MKSSTRIWLLVLALVGLGAALASSYVHYRLLTDPGFTSFCDVNATMNCTQAYMSRYGSLWGVPVAFLGVLFFALVLAIAGLAGRAASPARENAGGYVFALSTIGLAFVLYLGWASYVVLGTFCVLCAITYAAVVAIFIVSGAATTFPMLSLPGRATRDVRTLVSSPVALVIALLFVAAAVGAVMLVPEGANQSAATPAAAAAPLPAVSDEQRAKLAEWWEVQPKVDLPIPSDGAKVVIVKFNDFQCPACRLTHDAYKNILAKYTATGQVKYVVKHYPLDGECNPSVPNGSHIASCAAAAAVIMGRDHGTADKLTDWLFAHIGPPPLTPEEVKEAARTVGGITDFAAQYPRAKEEIRADAALGAKLGVNSTPTFYINGRKPTQILQAQFFEVLIQLELQRTN